MKKIAKTVLFLTFVFISIIAVRHFLYKTSVKATPKTLYRYKSVKLVLPRHLITKDGVQISTMPQKSYLNWRQIDHRRGYRLIQKVVRLWKEKKNTTQFIVLGEIKEIKKPFHWEIIPFKDVDTKVKRVWNLSKAYFAQTVSRKTLSKKEIKERQKFYDANDYFISKINIEPLKSIEKANDPFCDPQVIKQQTVYEGKKMRILYNLAPLGVGKERLHFLIIPKKHRKNFYELTEDEYAEAQFLSRKLIAYFQKTKKPYRYYLYHRTGKDAGQSVFHWHQHLLISLTPFQDVMIKLSSLKKSLIGHRFLSQQEVQPRVKQYRKEFSEVFSQ